MKDEVIMGFKINHSKKEILVSGRVCYDILIAARICATNHGYELVVVL